MGSVDAGSDVSRFHLGETLTVYYDAGHPNRIATAEDDSQSSWSVGLLILALVFGVIAVGLGVVGVVIRVGRRWRRTPAASSAKPRGRHLGGRVLVGRPSPVMALLGLVRVGITAVATVAEARNGTVSLARAIGDAPGSGAVAALMF